MSLNGHVAIITGGSKGIGRATAVALSAQGALVAINYGRDAAPADELVTQLGGAEKAIAIQADAGSVPGIDKIISTTVAKWGKIDIVFANAGIMPMRDLAATTEADFDSVMNLNVKGPYFLAQKAVPHMPNQPTSSIILVSTSLAVASTVAPGYLPYLASKGAIEQMTRVMAKDVGLKGIRVNAVAPGPTSTELFLKGKPQGLIDAIAGASPFKKLGSPEEIADVVVFLAGDSSKWVSGQVLRANGAMA
jgi:3-oxoacyl-[acyl-carrier protein] reductase